MKGLRVRITGFFVAAVAVASCGISDVIVEVDGTTDTLQITVDSTDVDQIAVSVSQLDLLVGQTATLSASAINPLGFVISSVPITWSSSDNGVAFATQDGAVTGISAGSATVFAVAEGVTATIPVVVTDTLVVPPPPPPPPPPGPLPSGGSADQTIDWGSFGSVGAALADPVIEGISWAPNVSLISDVPPQTGFDGSYLITMTSSDFLPGGFNIRIPNADVLRVRELFERWYMRFDPGFTMVWPGCGSAGMKVNLWGSRPDFQRTDFIMNENEFTMTMANAHGSQDWEDNDQLIQPSRDFFDGQWHRFELHLKMGSGFLAADAAYELWIDGQPAHELDGPGRPAWDPFSTSAGYGLEDYFSGSKWTDTYNCEQELGQTNGESITMAVSAIQRWWTSVPAWYEAIPSSQKYGN